MAKIGLNNFRYAILIEAPDGTPSYSGAKKPAKAISCNVDVSNNDAKLYADDVLVESDTSFNNGTVTIGIDKTDNTTMADLLGHAVDVSGEMVRKTTDVAPYVGLGRIITEMVNNVLQYRVEILYKCKFQEPSQEDETRGESVQFNTYELEGTVNALANGEWSKSKTFSSKADAITYLENEFSEVNNYVVTYNVNGGTGTVDSATVVAGNSVVLNDGTGLTYSNHTFKGWGTNPSSTTALTSPYTPTGDVTLYAIWEENE